MGTRGDLLSTASLSAALQTLRSRSSRHTDALILLLDRWLACEPTKVGDVQLQLKSGKGTRN